MIKSKGKIFTLAAAFALTARPYGGAYSRPPPRKRRSFPCIRQEFTSEEAVNADFFAGYVNAVAIPPWRNRSVRKTVTGF